MLSLNPGSCGVAAPCTGTRVGFDLVQVSRVASSINSFGDRFKLRLFSRAEIDYADQGGDACAERLAARLAAKEAVIKALKLSNAGINFRDIEVRKQSDGDCEIVLHGRIASLAAGMGLTGLALSLSHEGDYAGAFVMGTFCDQATSSFL